jgi:hypothetical protein
MLEADLGLKVERPQNLYGVLNRGRGRRKERFDGASREAT